MSIHERDIATEGRDYAEMLLSIDDVTVTYGRFAALSGVSLRLNRGEVLGIIGPNGAGKSSLIDAMTGFTAPARGTITFNGLRLDRQSPATRARLGLVRTFQTPELFETLSVQEHVMVVRESGKQSDSSTQRRTGPGAVLSAAGLSDRAATSAEFLPGGERKLLELARALAQNPVVLVLDEPVAGLPMRYLSVVVRAIRQVVEHARSGVILVEHNMRFIAETCDAVVVLNFGRVVASGTWDEVRSDQSVIEAYLGPGE